MDYEGRVRIELDADAFLNVAEKHPIFLSDVGTDVRKTDFMPHDIQEDPETWVPDMLGAIQKYRLNWAGWSFPACVTSVMLSGRDYAPTAFWGEPAKRALAGGRIELEKKR